MKKEESKPTFDIGKFESEVIEQLGSGKPLEGKDGVLAPLKKRLAEASLCNSGVSPQSPAPTAHPACAKGDCDDIKHKRTIRP